ncbi:MAG: cardiolipin synthase [Planctomycetota bacterium]
MVEFLSSFWTVLVAVITLLSAGAATAHAVLYKREERAVIGWVGLILLVPLLGSLLYAVLGINRIHRRARRLRPRSAGRIALSESWRQSGQNVAERLDEAGAARLIRLVDRLVHHPPVSGNRIELLENGEAAYPAMWEAIDSAKSTISLMTYIFETDTVGHRFIDALMRAQERGVQVRVLIDGVGARYSRPPARKLLENLGIPVAHFLPSIVPSSLRYSNLRNHRKVLVVDGCLAFTGGMNIRDGHLPSHGPKHPIQDVHARLQGPIVTQLQEVFLEDWQFATGEDLDEDIWTSECQAAGDVVLRAIPDGPDENFDVLRQTLLGAISVAERRVAIVTPYFLPDETVVAALNTAALRGVRVDIVLPEKNNLRLVQWASRPAYPWLLEKGCRIWHSPPPFEHTKLMLVDDYWALIGSGNWDARSLRLNFELNVEAYSNHFAADVRAMINARIERSRSISLAEAEQLPLPLRLRNGIVRLATPYL